MNADRKADRTYILTERELLAAVIRHSEHLLTGKETTAVARAQLEAADNGGAVLRVWFRMDEASKPSPRAWEGVTYEPQVIAAELKRRASELPGPVPKLREVQAWTEKDLAEVSAWLRALQAHANPIAGVPLPPIPDQPLVLFQAQPTAAAVPAKAPAKKRAQRGSLARAQQDAAQARASEQEQEQPEVDEQDGDFEVGDQP